MAGLATRQHGTVAVWQLMAMGFTRRWVERQAEAGWLIRLHRAVYAVGHTRLTTRGRWMAAILACGPEAVLSHHAAAALWQLRPSSQSAIDVTVPVKRSHPGIRCHVSRHLPPEDRTVIDALPATALARTVLDYAEISSSRQLAGALESAQRQEMLNIDALNAVMARSPGRRGLKPLCAALAELTDDVPWTQSEAESRFLELIAAARLPAPQVNQLIDGMTVDCVWPDRRLIIEVDGWRWHRLRRDFENDRRRDARLQIAGWRVVRFTAARIRDDPRAVIAELRALLA